MEDEYVQSNLHKELLLLLIYKYKKLLKKLLIIKV
jgi:hypothetical protein